MTPPDDKRRDADDYLRPHGSPAPEQPTEPSTEQPDPGDNAPDDGALGSTPPGYPGAPGHPGYGGYEALGYGPPAQQQPYPAYGPGPGHYGPTGHGPEQHPSATTALVLGIVSLAGILFCGGITLVLSPVAWWMGGKAVKEIDANPGRYSGRDRAQGGRVMGIIGTVLLALGLVFVVLALVIFTVAMPMGTFEGSVSAVPSDLR